MRISSRLLSSIAMKRILAIEPPRGDNCEESTTKIPSTGYQPKATEPDAVPSSTGTLVLSPAFEKNISEIFNFNH